MELIKHYALYVSTSPETLANNEKWMQNARTADLNTWFSHLQIMWLKTALASYP